MQQWVPPLDNMLRGKKPTPKLPLGFFLNLLVSFKRPLHDTLHMLISLKEKWQIIIPTRRLESFQFRPFPLALS